MFHTSRLAPGLLLSGIGSVLLLVKRYSRAPMRTLALVPHTSVLVPEYSLQVASHIGDPEWQPYGSAVHPEAFADTTSSSSFSSSVSGVKHKDTLLRLPQATLLTVEGPLCFVNALKLRKHLEAVLNHALAHAADPTPSSSSPSSSSPSSSSSAPVTTFAIDTTRAPEDASYYQPVALADTSSPALAPSPSPLSAAVTALPSSSLSSHGFSHYVVIDWHGCTLIDVTACEALRTVMHQYSQRRCLFLFCRLPAHVRDSLLHAGLLQSTIPSSSSPPPPSASSSLLAAEQQRTGQRARFSFLRARTQLSQQAHSAAIECLTAQEALQVILHRPEPI